MRICRKHKQSDTREPIGANLSVPCCWNRALLYREPRTNFYIRSSASQTHLGL